MERATKQEVPEEKRIYYWVFLPEIEQYVKVITLEDGTIHNAFVDKEFKEKTSL